MATTHLLKLASVGDTAFPLSLTTSPANLVTPAQITIDSKTDLLGNGFPLDINSSAQSLTINSSAFCNQSITLNLQTPSPSITPTPTVTPSSNSNLIDYGSLYSFDSRGMVGFTQGSPIYDMATVGPYANTGIYQLSADSKEALDLGADYVKLIFQWNDFFHTKKEQEELMAYDFGSNPNGQASYTKKSVFAKRYTPGWLVEDPVAGRPVFQHDFDGIVIPILDHIQSLNASLPNNKKKGIIRRNVCLKSER
jgi:hypothetical protein